MSSLPTAPGTIGDVLDHAIRIYSKSLFPCFLIVFVSVLITGVPAMLFTLKLQTLPIGDPLAVFAMFKSPDLWLTYLAMIVLSCVTYGALFARIDAIAREQPMTLGGAFAAGLRRTPTLLGVSILFGIIVGIGCMLLLIPGIYLWGLLQLAVVAAVVERSGVFDSFSTSARLVSGNWWRANIIIFVAFIIMVVLMFVVTFVVALVAGIFFGTAAAVSIANPSHVLPLGVQLIEQAVSAVMDVFIMTFLPSVLLAVYYDLKLRKEGGDLAARVGALNPAN